MDTFSASYFLLGSAEFLNTVQEGICVFLGVHYKNIDPPQFIFLERRGLFSRLSYLDVVVAALRGANDAAGNALLFLVGKVLECPASCTTLLMEMGV